MVNGTACSSNGFDTQHEKKESDGAIMPHSGRPCPNHSGSV